MKKVQPKIVFVDTEQFDARGLSFSHPIFQHLFELVDGGLAKVLLTDVVVGEVKRHIREKVADAKSQLGKNFGGLFKNLTKSPTPQVFEKGYWEGVEAELLSVFDACCTKLKATFIPISPEHVGPVFSWYFNYQSPFDKVKRKSEFPDAFSIAAINAWAKEHGQHVYAVTSDTAFSIAGDPAHLTHVATLAEFFEAFPKPEITKSIKEGFRDFLEDEANFSFGEEEFRQLGFYVEDANLEVGDVDVMWTEPHSMHVIEAEGGRAVLSGKLYVHFRAYVPALSNYVEDETCFVDSEIRLEYDESDPSQFNITSVKYERSLAVDISLPAKYRRDIED